MPALLPIIYVPGVDGVLRSGERILEGLADASCFQIDYNAHGVENFEQGEALLAACIAKFDGRVNLIGESWGSALSQYYLIRHPGEVERVVMLGGFTRNPAPLRARTTSVILRTIPAPIIRTPVAAYASAALGRGLSRDSTQRYKSALAQAPFKLIGARLAALHKFNMRSQDMWPQPTLWIWGEEEGVVPLARERDWLATHRPHDAQVLIENAGHILAFEHRDPVLRHIRNHFGMQAR